VKKPLITLLFCGALAAACTCRAVVSNTHAEFAAKNQWVRQNLLGGSNVCPFSFNYNGAASAGTNLFASWVRAGADTTLDPNRLRHTLTWTNGSDGLQVRCVAVEYSDFPAAEWTVYLTNASSANTPIIQSLQGLDFSFVRQSSEPEFVLNSIQGDLAGVDGPTVMGYSPFQLSMVSGLATNFSPAAGFGKSTTGLAAWPYWNLRTSSGGVIIAAGWSGQWAGAFVRDGGYGLRVQAGQQTTRLYLKPGEVIRTPLIELMFWQGTDVVRAQNLWRHFYLAHVIPRLNGQLPAAQAQIQVSGDDTNAVNQFLQAGISVDVCWRDAGGTYPWYPSGTGPYTGDNVWLNTGTWDVDTIKYPSGFKPFSDYAHSQGMKFLLWHEPERVGDTNASWLWVDHPDWLLQPGSVGLILNEGNPAAFNWLTNHFDSLIKAQGIDWYREDMNGNGPATSWAASDGANRQGITENLYVQAHLAYWDTLLKMNPGLRIDECAGGGGRHDLEHMRRAVPLTRSDFQYSYQAYVVEGNQCQTYGLSSWLPFQGSGSFFSDVYSFRSFYLPSFGMAFGLTPQNAASLRQAYAECRKVGPCMLLGDYDPLTPYSLANNVWMAWQFDRPDTGEGVVQVFRRTNSAVPSLQFQLRGLNPAQAYSVEDFDRGALGYYTGNQLMTTGLVVQLAPQQSAIPYYTTPPLAVWASSSSQAGFVPLTVQCSVTGTSTNGGPLTYAWTFGDGGSSTNQNPIYTYTTSGRYTARVTVQDGNGNSAAAQIAISASAASRKLQLTFPGYNRTETLTNFPTLVVFGPNLLGNGFGYDQFASTNGWDLLFLDPTLTQELNYEIESWNPYGNSYIWVQVPQLSTNTSIWVCWGDPNRASVPAPYLTNGATWANGYVGVWHLSEARGFARDSSPNLTAGVVYTTYGSVTRGVGGEIANAYSFGGGYISCSSATLPSGSNPRTVSAWFRKNSAATASPGKEILGYGNNTLTERFGLWIGGNGTANALGVENCGAGRTFLWTSDGQWHQLAAVLPGGQSDLRGVQLYYDGSLNNSATG
jgi:alpha-galactosidase